MQYYPSGLPWADCMGADYQNRKYNGKEFIEMHGYDSYDYHARHMFAALMRFTTPDPLAEKYYSISNYAYCANNPVRFVDPDGREPRIYVETKGFGHAFVTVGTGNNTIVYTYGRYGELGKNKSSARGTTPTGEGVLIKLTGSKAKEFIKDQMLENEAVAFEFKKGSDELVANYFDNIFDSSDKIPTTGRYKDNENARVVDTYNLFNNNCVTMSIDGVQSGVQEDLKLDGVKGPMALKDILNTQTENKNSSVVKVNYEEVKKELELTSGAGGSW